MRTGRNLVVTMACAGAALLASPALAGAQTTMCKLPQAWYDAQSDTNYEYEIFYDQTAYDAKYVTTSNATYFAINTTKRSMTFAGAMTNITTTFATTILANPPRCV